jgi:yeast amino acid transporter
VPSNASELDLTSGKGTAAASPFVIAIKRAGIKGLPSVMQAQNHELAELFLIQFQ